MRRRIIFGTLLALVIGGIAAAFIWGPDGDWDRTRGNRFEVVQVAEDGTSATGTGETLIIEGQRPFFFPFGLLLFPLVIFLLFGLFRGAFFGGGGPGGESNRFGNGSDPAWLDEWHRRQHQEHRQAKDTTTDPPA